MHLLEGENFPTTLKAMFTVYYSFPFFNININKKVK